MCGLAGLFDLTTERRPVDRGLLARMNDRIAHRGPDGDGFFQEAGIGLAHRRLAIIDLAGGDQPLFNEDGSVVVVFNGEIYNYRDLTRELQARGHQFRTSCDTEVLVHGWEEWGEALVERLRGMFAFALWDARQDRLFLARDRLGIKPLYYAALPDGQLVFGSELKALLVHPKLERKIDPRAVADYFAFGYVPDPRTIYDTVAKLPPAHGLSVTRGTGLPQPRRYWSPGDGDTAHTALDDGPSELAERLREAVDIRLVSEVPLGAFLSGGIDSSAVVATMAGLTDDPVNTCSIGFSDATFDETRYASMVAQRYRTNHHVRRVDVDAFDLIDTLVDAYDEPFADSSALPTYQVCGLARERVTVALSGDGGDEVFWGYLRYRWHADENRRRRKLAPFGGRSLASAGAAMCPRIPGWSFPGRVKETLEALARPPLEAFFHTLTILDDPTRQRILSDELRTALQGYRPIEAMQVHYDNAPTDHPVGKVQHVDMMTYLPGDILTKVDRASMAHALEVRVPILDHKLVEWAHTLPPQAKLAGSEGKAILKRAVEPLLPYDLIYRRKMGFAVPLNGWFRGPLRDQVRRAVTGPRLADTGWFDPRGLESLLAEHETRTRDHGQALWALLMFDRFLARVHEGAPAMPERTAAPAPAMAVG
jgi:asparagine synthase (glutamine-hydrolysing)